MQYAKYKTFTWKPDYPRLIRTAWSSLWSFNVVFFWDSLIAQVVERLSAVRIDVGQ